jgi:mRNA interferase YafQ
MYSLLPTKEFRKSLKRIRVSGTFKKQGEEDLRIIIGSLSQGIALSASYRDHQLTGKLSAYRECHVKGDLLLIYKIDKVGDIVLLVQIGSHSYLNL